MKRSGIVLKGFRLNKKGQLERNPYRLNVAARLKQQGSKRVRVAKGYNRP